MNVESGSTCLYAQLWDIKITRIKEEKMLWLELFPILCLLVLEMEKWVILVWPWEDGSDEYRILPSLLVPWDNGNLHSCCIGQQQLYVAEVGNQCKWQYELSSLFVSSPLVVFWVQFSPPSKKAAKVLLLFCYSPTFSSAVQEVLAANLV